jgi:hypothetical protein
MPVSPTRTLRHAATRKSVSIVRDGNRLSVTTRPEDGPPQRKVREFGSEREASHALESLLRELEGRGFSQDGEDDDHDEPTDNAPLLPRLRASAPAEAAPSRAKGGKKRKKKAKADREGLLVKLGLGATGAAILGLALFLAWALFGPATLVGSWTCSRGPLLARIRMEGGQLQRVLTFEKGGTAYAVYPELSQWSKGSYRAANGKLSLRFDRRGSFEEGEEPSPDPEVEEYSYTIRRGLLELTDSVGKKVDYLHLAPQSEESTRAVLARIPRNPPPPAPVEAVAAELPVDEGEFMEADLDEEF